MKLVLDFGNTFTKIGVFEANDLVENSVFKKEDISSILNFIRKFDKINSVILSSVTNYNKTIENELLKYPCIVLNESTKIPITNQYETPQALGKDRLAGAVAGHFLFPDNAVLIIDAGTCITIDFVNEKGEFYGGAILPGLEMKLNALHNFTEKLPLIDLSYNNIPLIGTNTKNSILSGIINGTIYEIDGFIDSYSSVYKNLKIILSGGDAKYFEKKLKNKNFAISNIVLIGLNQILEFNVKNI